MQSHLIYKWLLPLFFGMIESSAFFGYFVGKICVTGKSMSLLKDYEKQDGFSNNIEYGISQANCDCMEDYCCCDCCNDKCDDLHDACCGCDCMEDCSDKVCYCCSGDASFDCCFNCREGCACCDAYDDMVDSSKYCPCCWCLAGCSAWCDHCTSEERELSDEICCLQCQLCCQGDM